MSLPNDRTRPTTKRSIGLILALTITIVATIALAAIVSNIDMLTIDVAAIVGTVWGLIPPVPAGLIGYVGPVSVITMAASAGLMIFVNMRLRRAHQCQQQELDRLFEIAMRDNVCGVANRIAFLEEARAHLGKPESQTAAVLMMDLAQFKAINDVHGHHAGDEVLRVVAGRISSVVADRGLVARLGGDEYSVLFRDPPGMMEIIDMCEDILATLDEPIKLGGKSLFTGTAIGIARWPHDGDDPDELINKADMAMYLAKTSDEERWHFYDDAISRKVQRSQSLADEIRTGLERGEFDVSFQPQVSLCDDRLVGLEAMVRWHHPSDGLLRPPSFFQSASDHGLIIDIHEFVFSQLIKNMLKWADEAIDFPAVSLNVHGDQLSDPEHIYWLERAVKRSKLHRDKLILEITEGCLIGRGTDKIPDILERWRDLGMKIYLDDFGIGYASLSHLKDLPVDGFKIDSSFIRDMVYDDRDKSIVQISVKLAQSLDLAVVAVGVETVEQAAFLKSERCPVAQGNYYKRPMDGQETLRYLKSRQRAGAAYANA